MLCRLKSKLKMAQHAHAFIQGHLKPMYNFPSCISYADWSRLHFTKIYYWAMLFHKFNFYKNILKNKYVYLKYKLHNVINFWLVQSCETKFCSLLNIQKTTSLFLCSFLWLPYHLFALICIWYSERVPEWQASATGEFHLCVISVYMNYSMHNWLPSWFWHYTVMYKLLLRSPRTDPHSDSQQCTCIPCRASPSLEACQMTGVWRPCCLV